MYDRLRRCLDRAGRQDGFTLIELLIVIVVLGILSAIVVFAVGGINNRGQLSACVADKKTVQTAQEAYFAEKSAGNGSYGTEQELVDAQFLSDLSDMHSITPADPDDSYDITQDGDCAGLTY